MTITTETDGPAWVVKGASLLALAAGLGLGLPVLLPSAAPLQFPALVLFWWLLRVVPGENLPILKLSATMGLGYGIARIMGVMLPIPVLAVLLVGATLFWMATGWMACRFWRLGPGLGSLAMGGWLVLAEWVFQHVLPLFGSGQSFVLSWSPWGHWLPFVPLFGMPMLVFLLGSLSWLAAALFSPGPRTGLVKPLAFSVLLAALPFAAGVVWKAGRPPGESRKIAVWGCPVETLKGGKIVTSHLLPAMEEASRQGAGLIVFPEMILQNGRSSKGLEQLRGAAARLGLTVVVGWFDDGMKTANRLTIIGSDGKDAASYIKTNLVPLLEAYDLRGDGVPASADWKGVRLGAMICQDDNFPAMAWRAASLGANLLTVPTFDWPGVHHTHFLNSRWRPQENGMALAKAAIGGHSAVVDAEGGVLASRDCTLGPALVVAEVVIPLSPSPYHLWGDWPLLAVSAAVLAAGLARLRRPPGGDIIR